MNPQQLRRLPLNARRRCGVLLPNSAGRARVNTRSMMLPPKALRVLAVAILCAAASSFAAVSPESVKTPPGWRVTIFAEPPNVGYPTCLSTAPNGDLYVGIDENGSLDARAGRGRVVRCTDTDHDGKADGFVTFASMDSPRGIWFDNHVLYVMHPPLLEAFVDENGDGKADRSDVLVRGLGFDLKFRGADHTVNGMRMGIDGFLYIAVGDYGATNAVAKDGTAIQLHGGGVVRVRPDGTGLEIVSHGQRNIYDVAVSPELDLFTRDNTNDGDGWDVRLSHVVMGGDYGYPSLFKKFGDEIIQPLADLGGGSPCGALFMDEPDFPEGFGRGLYTVEWGRGGIFRHPLTPKGASFTAKQEKFIELQRPTDFDVDGSGRLYISSWQGATFTYNGPNAGFIARVTPPGWTFRLFPDLTKESDAQLMQRLESPGAFMRLYAQREILRREARSFFAERLEKLALSKASLPSRIAAVFTLRQLGIPAGQAALLRLTGQTELREFTLRALADDLRESSAIPTAIFVNALGDSNPRMRLQAASGVGRLGKNEAAGALLPLVADNDPMVAHVAVHSLIQLRASDVCFGVLDSGSADLLAGTGRVLQALHEPAVVNELIGRLNTAADPNVRATILKTLARLARREAAWDGRWWGTRPDTTGPYFKPVTWSESEKIEAVLRAELARAEAAALPKLVVLLQQNRVEFPELIPTMIRLAERDAEFREMAVDMFSRRRSIPDDAITFMANVAASTMEKPELRARSIRALAKSGQSSALEAAVHALTQSGEPSGEIAQAWTDLARDPRNNRHVAYFARLADEENPERRLLAYAVLANLAAGRSSDRNGKAAAVRAVEAGWSMPDRAVSLLRAIERLKLEGYAEQVRGLLNASHPEVAAAARTAARTLKLNIPAVNSAVTIEKLSYDEVLAVALKEKGDREAGAELFTRAGCVACHTTRANEAPKGPFLGGIATRYSRAELCESILKPNAKIAQGFESQWFKTKDDEEIEGFVTREGGDDLDVRNAAGLTLTLGKKDIIERGKREKSMMPEGLVNALTPAELASLLAFLESTTSQ